jgi:hypothetical protein
MAPALAALARLRHLRLAVQVKDSFWAWPWLTELWAAISGLGQLTQLAFDVLREPAFSWLCRAASVHASPAFAAHLEHLDLRGSELQPAGVPALAECHTLALSNCADSHLPTSLRNRTFCVPLCSIII